MDKSKFERVYTLEQQTPLIHFQYDQPGATLRATEVKPKLDKFITAKLGGKEKVRKNHKSWILRDEDGKMALDYMVKINGIVQEKVKLGYKTDYDIYYGNMGGAYTKGVLYVPKSVRVIIHCMNAELLDMIDGIIGDFFIAHNFGRMQNKGFGSFVCAGRDKSEEHIAYVLCDVYKARTCYTFKAGDKAFARIKIIYSLMKSGLNFGGKYRRSLLFMYMRRKKNLGNEKAWMKQEELAPSDCYKTDDNKRKYDSYRMTYQRQNYKYVRALMGVGDHYDFQLMTGGKTTISVSNEDIERCNSTVFFKVIGEQVYYVGRRIIPEIFGKQFKFRSAYSNSTKELQVPSPDKDKITEDFMDDFLAYCKEELNSQRLLDGGTPMTAFLGMRDVKISEIKGGAAK